MKTCTKCGEQKKLCDFYQHKAMASGFLSACKDCTKARVREHRKCSESVREYDRMRAKRPERRSKSREITSRWRKLNPIAYHAQTAVGNALRDGKLKRDNCLFCGTSSHVHAHHKDYTKPLDVIWLCAKCHHRLHANFPETEGHGHHV